MPRRPGKYSKRVSELLKQSRVSEPPVDIQQVARVCGARVQRGDLPDELSGFLYRHKDSKQPIIGVNSEHPPSRQRFTIAHEIGHLILHKALVHVDRVHSVSFRDARSATAEDRSEIQANKFAAELLMPVAFISRDLSGKTIHITNDEYLKELAERYDVSPQAMTWRLVNLGYIK